MMPENQTNTFAARWEKIWEVDSLDTTSTCLSEKGEGLCFSGWAHINEAAFFEVRISANGISCELALSYFCLLRADENGVVELGNYLEDSDEYKSGATWGKRHWDDFRRRSWLSGCPIEASAHEKAEWMQGLTREEVESWNLQF